MGAGAQGSHVIDVRWWEHGKWQRALLNPDEKEQPEDYLGGWLMRLIRRGVTVLEITRL